VTVDKKTGAFTYENATVDVVDLPGIYSLNVFEGQGAIDERIACDYLLETPPDLIVNVIDASNLERNLYLTAQLLEMGLPVLVALNMMDIVKKRGLTLDQSKLAKLLGCPVVGIVANRAEGIEVLQAEVIALAKKQRVSSFQLPLPSLLQASVAKLETLADTTGTHKITEKRWLALRLLETDKIAEQQAGSALTQLAKEQRDIIQQDMSEEADILIADARYSWGNDLALKVLQLNAAKSRSMTMWLDRIVLNRYLGIPIFFFVMYLMFLFAINVGGAFQDFFDIGSNTIFVNGLAHGLAAMHWPTWIIAFLASGVGKGINTTITFIPVIGGMFLFLSFLEDSGYMARAAFVMDRCMQSIGLPGKAFVPMIVGFGCNVPAVMGARTLENKRDRILAVMMMPFMSCGARLAIFAVFAAAFFRHGGQDIIFLLYLVGILAAVLTGFLLRQSLLQGEPAPLIMELPPYHLPRFKVMMRQTWQRLKKFLHRAGKMIIPVCILIGALNGVTLTGKLTYGGSDQSVLSDVGRAVTPVLAPLGVQQKNWPATVGLVTGVLAKEVVVGTLNSLYSEVDHLTSPNNHFNLWAGLKAAVMSIPENLAALPQAFSNPVAASEAPHDMNHAVFGVMEQRFSGRIGAFAYLLFILLYFPCVSTMAVMRREVGRAWTYFSMGWSTFLAYGLSVVTYQTVTLSAHVLSSSMWIMAFIILFSGTIIAMKRYAAGGRLQGAS